MIGYNLQATTVCNINDSCANIAEFRSEYKSQLELESSAPSKATNDKLAETLTSDKTADAHINSAKGHNSPYTYEDHPSAIRAGFSYPNYAPLGFFKKQYQSHIFSKCHDTNVYGLVLTR